MLPNHRTRGFSLMELMAVVAILAVLSTVAITSSRSYMRRAHNAEGVAFLMDIKMKQETYFMTYSRYVSTADSADGWMPATFNYPPSPWNSDGVWNCAAPTSANSGYCALGITPQSEDTYFQYVTIGWSPTAADPGNNPQGGPWIRDLSRRWWFARARTYAGTGTSLYLEYRISSELAQMIEIQP